MPSRDWCGMTPDEASTERSSHRRCERFEARTPDHSRLDGGAQELRESSAHIRRNVRRDDAKFVVGERQLSKRLPGFRRAEVAAWHRVGAEEDALGPELTDSQHD